jgi:peptide/nickel transport system substrate-binding protein
MPVDPDHLSRRSYLKFAGAATATASLAGCTGGDGDDGSGADTATPEPEETEMPEETQEPEDTETEEPVMSDLQVGITMGNMDSGLDPQDHAETNTDIVVRRAYERLLDRAVDGSVIPGLAREWQRAEDGAAYFQLREGVTFHNGDPLTSEDAVFSIRRIVFDDVDFVSPQSGDLGNVTGVQPGDRAVTVLFDSLNPIAFQLFATNGEIMQKSWVEENSTDFINQNANGTGPFELSSYDSGNEVVFDRFDDYWDGAAQVGGVTLNASTEPSTRVNRLLAEESDIVTNVPPQEVSRVQSSDVAAIQAVPSTRIIFLQMRFDVEPFSSVKFRQAMNYAVDVESIIESVLNGFGKITGQPTLSEFVGHNPDIEPYPHDPDQAEQLVEESGFAGAEITLQTPIGRYLKDVEIAQAAANQINSLSNVTCQVQQRDFAALVQDLLTGNIEDKPHFNLLGWGNGEFDASQTIGPLLTSSGFLTILKNDEVDQLMQQAANEPDPEAREETLHQANQKLHDLAPWVFMHQQFSVYGVSDRIDWEPRSDEDIDPDRASPN